MNVPSTHPPLMDRFGVNHPIFTIIVICVGISAAFVGLSTAVMTVLCWHAVPYWDQWDNLISGRNVTWAWLISQHNEHRIVFPRLIYFLDAWFFHETNLLELFANFALQIGTVIIVIILGFDILQPSWRSLTINSSFVFR